MSLPKRSANDFAYDIYSRNNRFYKMFLHAAGQYIGDCF